MAAIIPSKLEDIKSLMKLQKDMVLGSGQFARLIVQHHMPDALTALGAYKGLKHPKIKQELDLLLGAWKTTEEAVQRDETLMRFQTKIQDKIQERSDQIDRIVS